MVKRWDALDMAAFARLAEAFRQGRDLQLLDKTHMLPMEAPALTARLIADAITPYGT